MTTKICTICKLEKCIDLFAWKNKSKNTKAVSCKECHKKVRKNYYENNKLKETKRITQRKNELKQWFKELKSKLKCNRCDEDHYSCIEFHHKDPKEKDFLLSYAYSLGLSKERILREIEKCEILCSNCHRKHHWNEKNAGITQMVE